MTREARSAGRVLTLSGRPLDGFRAAAPECRFAYPGAPATPPP